MRWQMKEITYIMVNEKDVFHIGKSIRIYSPDRIQTKNMDCDKEEYRCNLSFCTAFDPVYITPTTFLYDRNNAETWLEKHPRTATIPHTRQRYVAADITPNVALRAEMRQYFQSVMGKEYTGWEVIPDYPRLLSLDDIRNLLVEVLQHFPSMDAEENLSRMSEESWSNSWKRLTYLRLNLQLNAINRQLFLSDEQSIKSLSQFIVVSYAHKKKNEESDLFHREILRTIRALDLTAQQERFKLKPENGFECARFTGFLLRFLRLGDDSLLPVVLGLLSLVAQSLKPEQLYCILAYLSEAEPVAVSSTDLTNLAWIHDGFFHSNFTEDNSPLILQMQKKVVGGFIQILIYALGMFKSEDRMGVVEDACEALRVSLFHLDQLLEGPVEFRETRLGFSIDMNLLIYIHDMIEQAVTEQSPHWIHLSANQWLLALNNAKLYYQNLGNSDIMTVKLYRLYLSFLNSPIARDSEVLRDSVNVILEMFRRFVDVKQYVASIDP